MSSLIESYGDVTGYGLTDERREQLLASQTECTFIWANSEGWPVGVIMYFVYHDGRVWLTASAQRKRIAAVRREPRVSICVSSVGTSMGGGKTVTFKGLCAIRDDVPTKEWFYPALAEAIIPGSPLLQENFIRFLDSPRRVILEFTPQKQIAYDGDLMAQATLASLAAKAKL